MQVTNVINTIKYCLNIGKRTAIFPISLSLSRFVYYFQLSGRRTVCPLSNVTSSGNID